MLSALDMKHLHQSAFFCASIVVAQSLRWALALVSWSRCRSAKEDQGASWQDWFNVPWFFKVATAFSFFSGPGTVHARRTRLLYGRRNRFEVSTKRSWISIRNVQLLIWGRLWENLGGLPVCARVSKEWPKTWKHFRKQILYRKVYFDFLWNAFLPTQKTASSQLFWLLLCTSSQNWRTNHQVYKTFFVQMLHVPVALYLHF